MYTPTISKCKFGDCSKCGAKDTDVVKLGKELFCLACNREVKTKQQLSKANVRQKVRSLGNKQVADGNYFQAEKQALILDLDYTHSRLVRMIAADSVTGLANCFVCGKLQHWTLCQLSHFIKRQNTLTRWDLKANRCSCRHCNETLEGNLELFSQKLNEEENGLAERLIEISKEVHKWSREELKQLLIDQRQRLRIIEKKFQPQKT